MAIKNEIAINKYKAKKQATEKQKPKPISLTAFFKETPFKKRSIKV